MNQTMLRIPLVLIVAALPTSCARSYHGHNAADPSRRAVTAGVVEFYPARHSGVHGLLHLRSIDKGLLFRGNVMPLKAGLYGFGIHENGDCSAFDGKSAGPLVARGEAGKAEPFGRLDDLLVEHDGGTDVERVEEKLSLSGPDSIVGKSLVVEAWPFDPKVDPASVPFVACGVIRAE